MNPSAQMSPVFPQQTGVEQPNPAPQFEQQVPQSPPQISHHASSLGRKIVILSLSILFFMFVSSVAFASLSVYTPAVDGFTTPEQQKALALFVYKIPLLPKTPEQILLAAVESNSELTTYSPEFSMSGSLGSSAVTIGSFDMKTKGKVDFSKDKQPAFDLAVDVGLSFAGTSYQASGQLRKVENKVYYKIDKLSDSIIDTYTSFSSQGSTEAAEASSEEIKAALEKIFAKWAMYDIASIESEAREALDKRGRDSSLVDSTRRKVQDILLQDTILPEVVRKDDESIDNTSTYHLAFNPSKEALRNTIRELYPKEEQMDKNVDESVNSVVDAISTLQIDAWFGKSDAVLRKVSVQTTISLNNYYESLRSSPRLSPVLGMQSDLPLSTFGSITNPIISTSLVLTVRDIGKPVVIESPSGAISTNDYWQELQDATKTEDQKIQEAKRKSAQNGFTILSKTLLKEYVDNGIYPASLVGLSTSVDTSSFTYKRSGDGRDYILYIESEGAGFSYSESTPYYGITSDYSYPHQLTKRDFDLL